ncbi:MAG: tRNA (guanosine(46)-N7)-methyltransferase TrmB [Thermincolia bacterium]
MRFRRRAKIEKKIRDYDDLILYNPEQNKGRWSQFFGNDNPIHVEFGTGKGKFIATMAKENPGINYIGVEVQKVVLYQAAKKARAKEVSNLILMVYDVAKILNVFERDEIQRVYLNFSDPWPKKRHAKRRLTHTNFLNIYNQLFEPGREIYFKTDNEGLFEFSLNEFSANGFRLKNITLDLHNSDFEGNVTTEYEEKFVNRGMKIYRCEAVCPGVWAALDGKVPVASQEHCFYRGDSYL